VKGEKALLDSLARYNSNSTLSRQEKNLSPRQVPEILKNRVQGNSQEEIYKAHA
jgi:hypothetical protein